MSIRNLPLARENQFSAGELKNRLKGNVKTIDGLDKTYMSDIFGFLKADLASEGRKLIFHFFRKFHYDFS